MYDARMQARRLSQVLDELEQVAEGFAFPADVDRREFEQSIASARGVAELLPQSAVLHALKGDEATIATQQELVYKSIVFHEQMRDVFALLIRQMPGEFSRRHRERAA